MKNSVVWTLLSALYKSFNLSQILTITLTVLKNKGRPALKRLEIFKNSSV